MTTYIRYLVVCRSPGGWKWSAAPPAPPVGPSPAPEKISIDDFFFFFTLSSSSSSSSSLRHSPWWRLLAAQIAKKTCRNVLHATQTLINTSEFTHTHKHAHTHTQVHLITCFLHHWCLRVFRSSVPNWNLLAVFFTSGIFFFLFFFSYFRLISSCSHAHATGLLEGFCSG